MTTNERKTRREALGILGAGVTMLVGCGETTGNTSGNTAACASKQETTVGPYPNIDPLQRRDVRGNTTGATIPKEGASLTLKIRVYDVDAGCAPLSGALVDIWHCDATGVYAGYAAFSTTGQDFCRGYQATDQQGMAEFLSIFPGSYSGRAIHIHFSIQGTESNLRPNDEGTSVPGVFVAQLYFERSVADAVFAATPIYQQGAAITPNDSDGIYSGAGGAALVVRMTKSGDGYIGEIDIGVKRADIGK
jgi:protocatechuate 3,4-dioxygenase beta subunit